MATILLFVLLFVPSMRGGSHPRPGWGGNPPHPVYPAHR